MRTAEATPAERARGTYRGRWEFRWRIAEISESALFSAPGEFRLGQPEEDRWAVAVIEHSTGPRRVPVSRATVADRGDFTAVLDADPKAFAAGVRRVWPAESTSEEVEFTGQCDGETLRGEARFTLSGPLGTVGRVEASLEIRFHGRTPPMEAGRRDGVHADS